MPEAPMGKRPRVWPCGHPRTPENTQSVGAGGVRCRKCRRKIARDSKSRTAAKRAALLAALTLAGCTGPVDQPFDTAIRSACAKQFPRDQWRRWQCVDLGRYAYVRQQRLDALNEAQHSK